MTAIRTACLLAVLAAVSPAAADSLPNLPTWKLDTSERRDGHDYKTSLTFKRAEDGRFSTSAVCTGPQGEHRSEGPATAEIRFGGNADLGTLGWAMIDHPEVGGRLWIQNPLCASGPYRVSRPPIVHPKPKPAVVSIAPGFAVRYDAARWKLTRPKKAVQLEFIIVAPDPDDQQIGYAKFHVRPIGPGTPSQRITTFKRSVAEKGAPTKEPKTKEVQGGPTGRYWIREPDESYWSGYVLLFSVGGKDIFVEITDESLSSTPKLKVEILKGLFSDS